MARITIEDCLKAGYNKFGLVHLTAKRVLQLSKGEKPLVPTLNKVVVSALREIAAEKVKMKEGDNPSGDDSEKESEGTDKGEDILDQSEELSDET